MSDTFRGSASTFGIRFMEVNRILLLYESSYVLSVIFNLFCENLNLQLLVLSLVTKRFGLPWVPCCTVFELRTVKSWDINLDCW